MKTVGVINRIDDKKVIEIAEPFGVVAAIVSLDQSRPRRRSTRS